MATNWKRSDEVVWEELGSEILVVSPRSGGRWTLNAKAAALWKLCDGSYSVRELAAMSFCNALARIGLLFLAPSTSSPVPIAVGFSGLGDQAPAFRVMGLTAGGRRRPTPRGNSGPG